MNKQIDKRKDGQIHASKFDLKQVTARISYMFLQSVHL